MSAGTDTILAARLQQPGEPLVVERVPLSAPAPGEVRVRLEFGGVNPVDRYTADGRVSPDGPRPRTLGGEGAGIVDGQAVLVAGEGLGGARDGVWAQAANVPREAVVPIPDGVQPRAAAAMGIAGLTALNCVRELGRVTDGDRALVLGASGRRRQHDRVAGHQRRGDGLGSDRIAGKGGSNRAGRSFARAGVRS